MANTARSQQLKFTADDPEVSNTARSFGGKKLVVALIENIN